MTDASLDHMTRACHRLDPWPDAVEGLVRLKRKYVIAPCSNGNIALMVNLAKRAGLPCAFVLRRTEHGPGQSTDLVADASPVDLAAEDFEALAAELGC